MTGQPMPHDPGCHGRSHVKRGEKPCEAFRAELAARKQSIVERRRGDCYCCTRTDTPVHRHGTWTLCMICYERWQRDGFRGAGPGPVRWHRAIDRARENAVTIMWLSLTEAADRIGVTPKTIGRWRKLLRTEQEKVESCPASSEQSCRTTRGRMACSVPA